MNVTGCLTQTKDGAKQFVLKSGEVTYTLAAGEQDLRGHLGKTVKISGISLKGDGPHDDDRIQVTDLVSIAATCSDGSH